jgi:hypothetical protein
MWLLDMNEGIPGLLEELVSRITVIAMVVGEIVFTISTLVERERGKRENGDKVQGKV